MRKSAGIFTFLIFLASLSGVSADSLEKRIQRIMDRPEFRHSIFGIEFYSLDKQKPIYKYNAEKLFVPGSTTKLITAGSALELFGSDYRFHTRVYRTGEIGQDGALDGDLVLVAAGDPNLSGRVTKDDTLTFEDEDHSYGGSDSKGVSGDPLLVIRKLARQVADRGIKRINGRVLVDASLFQQGEHELGTGVTLSPVMVNDNLVDVLVLSGPSENSPAVLKIAPLTSYVHIINHAKTGKENSEADLHWASDVENSDGSRTVTLEGMVPAGSSHSEMFSYSVPDPARYSEIVLTEALRESGIVANARLKEDQPNYKTFNTFYTPDRLIAEHISPPMTEEVKVMLKVSQNLHASVMPYLLGSLIAHKDPPQSGFDLIRDFLSKAGLDVSGASQSDGAGGSAHFTPVFMVSYLVHMATQKNYNAFHDALPILGKDGTLVQIQVKSPAAGHVYAKTGTYFDSDLLHQGLMVTGKALAGYVTTVRGRHLAFAIFVNNVPLGLESGAIRKVVGEAVGEIAAAAYDY